MAAERALLGMLPLWRNSPQDNDNSLLHGSEEGQAETSFLDDSPECSVFRLSTTRT